MYTNVQNSLGKIVNTTEKAQSTYYILIQSTTRWFPISNISLSNTLRSLLPTHKNGFRVMRILGAI